MIPVNGDFMCRHVAAAGYKKLWWCRSDCGYLQQRKRVDMRMVVLWGLLVLLQLQVLVSGHTLGRTASSASELDQLQVLTRTDTLKGGRFVYRQKVC